MKISKRCIKSTLELSVGLVFLLDLFWMGTGVIALMSVSVYLFLYIKYRCEARLNCRHSKTIKEQMTLSDIKYIETKYTQRPDFNSPQKRALMRSPLDRFFYHDRYERVQSLLKTYALGCNTILDLGCGFGRNTRFISNDLQKTGYGLELDHLKLVWARSETKRLQLSREIPFVCGDVAGPPFAPGSFDCIVFTEVLEHLIDPMAGLDACRDFLCQNGVLIITVPSRHNLNYSNNPFIIIEKLVSLSKDSVLPPFHDLHAQFEYNWKKPEPEYGIHYNFTRQTIDKALLDRGFRTILRNSFELEIYPYLLIEMLSKGNLKVITKYVGGIEKFLAKLPLVKLLGQHLIYVAVKK